METGKRIIHSDPDILGGTPVFVGTRVPVKTLLDYLEAGDSLDEFLDHFPSVTREQAVAAAVKLHELGRLSSGRAAELAGLSRVEFLLTLGRYKVFPFAAELDDLGNQNA